jgi:hypothetical protein
MRRKTKMKLDTTSGTTTVSCLGELTRLHNHNMLHLNEQNKIINKAFNKLNSKTNLLIIIGVVVAYRLGKKNYELKKRVEALEVAQAKEQLDEVMNATILGEDDNE